MARLSCGEKKRFEGKMVRVCVAVENDEVLDVLLTGDFFVEPEEGYDILLEEARRILLERRSLEELARRLEKVLIENDIRLYGIAVDDVIEALQRALASPH
uniref:Lipoate--protein ligase n=1 Tax=Fervidicoccus fontis TaxID=683846 RepID=A0A7J3ZLV5_9CREN